MNDKDTNRSEFAKSSIPKTFQLADLSQLPAALIPLTKEKRWVLWNWVWKGNRWTKIPFQVRDPGQTAESNNPETWGTFAEAAAQVRSGKAHGIGFCLLDGDCVAVDLDKCRDPESGAIAEWAQRIIDTNTYVE